jgi:hypothetical protein
MRTTDLIAALASDKTVLPPPGRSLARGLVPGVLIAMALFAIMARFRPDLMHALGTLRFNAKLVLNLLLALAAGGLLLRAVRPGARSGAWQAAIWLVPVLLGVAVILELLALPREQWQRALVGHNSFWCLTMIPLMGAAPLAFGIMALRSSAPSRPALAGALAGLLAAGIAGLLYATHCPDDSPLFVAVWYSIAATLLALVGAMLGKRLLSW